MFDINHNKNDQNQSVGDIFLTLCRLLLVLLMKVAIAVLKLLVKGIKWIIKMVKLGIKNLGIWWNDNSTQEKVAKIKAAIKAGAKATLKWLALTGKTILKWIIKGIIAVCKGVVIGAKATVNGIIHLKPTVIKIGKGIVAGWRATLRWLVRCGRWMKLKHIRHRRKYREFRQNKGFKGLMIDCTRAVKNTISTFMEEEDVEASEDAITEDDILEEEIDNKLNEDNKAKKIGKTIFSKAKEVVDVS